MRALRPIVIVAALSASLVASAQAQLETPSTGGIVALEQELRMLGHYKRVLMIGAHPDDEDTELLTVLVRGEGAEAAYLSLNRGEGGQNLIGPELGEALGLIRSEELLGARRLDGAQQFFTRAYDFGFSKNLADTWQHWPQDSVLKDVVRVIRSFRPQIVVTIFTGTPRDGHGQHQAAGWAAMEAFRLAGDATAFPDAGPPWAPGKLYRSTRFDSSATTLRLDGGELDPAVGQSYHQIAMRGRSLHRSQDMGVLQRMGPSQVRLQLVADRTGNGAQGLWAGIDTSLTALLRTEAGRLTPGAETAAAGLAARLDSLHRPGVAGAMETVHGKVGRLADDLVRLAGGPEGSVAALSPEILGQVLHLRRAEAISSGLVFDALADDDRVVPGQRIRVTLSIWNPSAMTRSARASLAPSSAWAADVPVDFSVTLQPGTIESRTFEIQAVPDAGLTEPYFLRLPRKGDLYDWGPNSEAATRPFQAPEFSAAFRPGDARVPLLREVALRTNNQAFGEIRRPVVLVPRVDVRLDPGTGVWSEGSAASHAFTVTLTHGARDTTSGRVWLEVPVGWPGGAPLPFRLTEEDERQTFRFEIQPPAGLRAGAYELRAVAEDSAGRRYAVGVVLVDYPHIHPRQFVRPASAVVNVAPLVVPRLARVGYIRGAADRVPEALQGVGVNIELLDHATLEHGDLSRYDAIIVGSRAYETDSALVANNARLLDYARAGGLVITQYQQYGYFLGGFAPWPLAVRGQPLRALLDSTGQGGRGVSVASINGHDRVTDENADVTILDRADPAMLIPNRIGPDDWRGWIQERGLYFAHAWNDHWRPVLEMHDPGESPLEGSLLVARVGRGTYVYSGISFFRQLPAGIPGAFRLFANLLALRQAPRP